MTLPRSVRVTRSTLARDPTALLPFFLPTAMVTAGYVFGSADLRLADLRSPTVRGAEAEPGVHRRFVGSVDHARDVAQVDRPVSAHADHQVAHLVDVPKERPGLHR